MNPALLRIAAGVGIGYFIFQKLARKPLYKLAVTTAKGAMGVSDRVAAAGSAVTNGWQDLVEDARSEMEKKKESRLVREAGSMMDNVSGNVAGYMHKTAETIENLADRLEYQEKEEPTLKATPDTEDL